eukprot:8241559-Pyramimonas_sp.AAC.1
MRHGCTVFSIDWANNRHRPAAPTLKLDLTIRAGRQTLHRIFGDPDVEAARFAPPGETFCRAKETPIPMRLRKESRPAPRP